MYIHIYKPCKCSECGSKLDPEWITRGNITYRRCVKCGHEKEYSRTSYTDSTDTVVWKMEESKVDVY